MTGTILNAAGILIGGILGLILTREIPTRTQLALKGLLGVATIFVGIKIMWMNMGGGAGQVALQFLIVMVAMSLGRLLGRGMRLQKGMNRLGAYAGERFRRADPKNPKRFNEGFLTATILFCAAPISIIGALLDGLGSWETLAIKTLLDGLATLSFVSTFGWGVILAVIPVAAWQGTIALSARMLAPELGNELIVASVSATAGMMVMSISLIILEVKKLEMADYLPAFVLAPLLTWWWLV